MTFVSCRKEVLYHRSACMFPVPCFHTIFTDNLPGFPTYRTNWWVHLLHPLMAPPDEAPQWPVSVSLHLVRMSRLVPNITTHDSECGLAVSKDHESGAWRLMLAPGISTANGLYTAPKPYQMWATLVLEPEHPPHLQQIFLWTSFALGFAADFVITSLLIYYLRKKRTKFAA
jgi:hypothetical protein